MNAHELARLLLDGPDLPVYVRGYEGGVDDVALVAPLQVVRDMHEASYYGRHGRWQIDAFDDDGSPTDGLQLRPSDDDDES